MRCGAVRCGKSVDTAAVVSRRICCPQARVGLGAPYRDLAPADVPGGGQRRGRTAGERMDSMGGDGMGWDRVGLRPNGPQA